MRAAFEVAVFGVPGLHLYWGEMLFNHNFLCRTVLVADDVQTLLSLGQAPAVKREDTLWLRLADPHLLYASRVVGGNKHETVPRIGGSILVYAAYGNIELGLRDSCICVVSGFIIPQIST